LSINSEHVIELPLDAFGIKSSPAVAPSGQMTHGLSTSAAKVDEVVVVVDDDDDDVGMSIKGTGVGEVVSEGQHSDLAISP
jgi:hypothetical protein